MRTTTYLGLLLGLAAVALAVWASGGDGSIFGHRAALLIVLGGTVAAATLASSRRTALHALSAASRLFLSPTVTTRQVAEVLVDLAKRARAGGGLAAIDLATLPIRDPFLLKGLHLLTEGVAPDRIEELLQLESEILSGRRAQAERLFQLMARSAPLFGVAGSVMSLLQLLPGLAAGADPWPALVSSLAATCYGLLLAGLFFQPLAGKVRTLDSHEQLVRDQMVTGLLAIRLGQNPEYVRESLEVFAQRNG